uniref:Testis cDNA, clone: QtsA-16245, similar to human membrane protein, palmitoylated 7 (MAGUK p55 subfamilymember 7) (MPP7) n=1 Tax=Macaca fascicularis TaxID=9541 RepID=Q4R758_MACFA|nr:unnamed protein product [Macaca fascicularis]
MVLNTFSFPSICLRQMYKITSLLNMENIKTTTTAQA